MIINASIYIARHERYEASQVYKDRLSPEQIEYLLDNEQDFRLEITEGKAQLLAIEDEG